MTPEQAIADVQQGKLRSIYLVVGEEHVLAERVLEAVRGAAGVEATAGFNVERFEAGEISAQAVVNAARTLPMMAPRRLVVAHGLERWDKLQRADEHPLDALARYAEQPVDSSVLFLVGAKVNASRRLVKLAKSAGFLVSCEPLGRRELPDWIRKEARGRGHEMAPPACDALAQLVGPRLGPVLDALERLSLYVGPGAAITEAALAEVVTRVRLDDVWSLVDAVSERNLARSLAVLGDALSTRDAALPLLGAVSSRVRQLIKYQSARAAGLAPNDAAHEARVPPFKVNDTERSARRLGARDLERWIGLLSEADLALKGSRRDSFDVLATMLIAMCS